MKKLLYYSVVTAALTLTSFVKAPPPLNTPTVTLSFQNKTDLMGVINISTYISDGQMVILAGESASGDQYPRSYTWSLSSTATADGENIIQPTSVTGSGRFLKAPPAPGVTSVTLASTDFSISNPTITTSGTITANLNASGVTPGTYEFVTVNSKGIITNGYNTVTNDLTTRAFGTAYQASVTSRTYDIEGDPKISIGTTLLTANGGQVVVEISANGSTGWTEKRRVENDNGGVLGSQNAQVAGLTVLDIPAGYWYRFTSTQNAGSATFVITNAKEHLRR